MKVKVFVKTVAPTKEEKYLQDIIDELHADLAAAEAQIETLNAALEAAYAHQEKTFQEKRDVERELVCAERDFKSLKTKFADACAERDNLTASYKQLVHNYGALQEQATDECADLREQLHDRNVRVAELEQRITFLEDQAAVHHEEKGAFEDALRGFEEMRQEYQKELALAHSEKRDWMQSAEQWRTKYETEHKAYEADKEKADAICKSCDEVYQRTLKERDEYKAQAEKMEKRAAFNRHLFEVAEGELKDRKEEVAALDRRVFELESSNDELRYKLEEAEKCITDQQRIITDAGETISNLRLEMRNPLPRTLSDMIMGVLNET